MTDGKATECKHLRRPRNLWIYCEKFQKTMDSFCGTIHRPWKMTAKFIYILFTYIYIYEYIHTCPHTPKRISSLLNQSSGNASQICHFICLFSTFRLSPVACAHDINYARLRQQNRHILGVSFKKSVCDLKEILWGLPGLSNLFYDSVLLGLDLFLSYFFLLCFSEEEFPVLKYHFDKQK